MEEEEEQIQRAIRESLRQKQQYQGNSPPSYGWSIPEDDDVGPIRPPYPTQQLQGDKDAHPSNNSRLYPDLTSRNTFPTPSAPPLEPNNVDESNLPYSPSVNWSAPPPYPVDSEIQSRRPLSFSNNLENERKTIKELDENYVRNARLRRFKKT